MGKIQSFCHLHFTALTLLWRICLKKYGYMGWNLTPPTKARISTKLTREGTHEMSITCDGQKLQESPVYDFTSCGSSYKLAISWQQRIGPREKVLPLGLHECFEIWLQFLNRKMVNRNICTLQFLSLRAKNMSAEQPTDKFSKIYSNPPNATSPQEIRH